MIKLPPIPTVEEMRKKVIDSQIWRSIFRGGVWKDTPRDRAQHILGNVWLHLQPSRVRKNGLKWTYSFGLGGLSFFLFLILTVTGVLLMFYYRPTVDLAYRDMKDLEYAVSMGSFIRAMHRWAAHSMVLIVILHMARVFMTGSYKTPREFNWIVGVVLLMLTLLLSFTGYLLPWDQLAFWAVTVGTNIPREAPIVGSTISFLLLGGNQIDQQTLLRFYVLHVFFLPVLLWMLFAYHMWRVRKDGGLAAVEPIRAERVMRSKEMPSSKSYSMFGLTPGTSVQVMSSTDLEEQDLVTSSPNLTRRMMLVFLAILNATLLAAILFNAPLEEAANAAVTPNPAKAPWYFVWLQELVASTTVRIGPFTISGGFLGGILLPGFLLMVLAVWPWLDRSPANAEGRWFPKSRRNQNGVFAAAIVAIVILIIIGVYLRGPYWKIYMPGT